MSDWGAMTKGIRSLWLQEKGCHHVFKRNPYYSENLKEQYVSIYAKENEN